MIRGAVAVVRRGAARRGRTASSVNETASRGASAGGASAGVEVEVVDRGGPRRARLESAASAWAMYFSCVESEPLVPMPESTKCTPR